MELLKLSVIALLLLGLIECKKYDNPYDLDNANKDFDGDGIKNKDDPDPRNKSTSQQTSGVGSTSSGVSTPSGSQTEISASISVKRWNVPLTGACTIAYRAANTSLYIYDHGASKVLVYSIRSGEPTLIETLPVKWPGTACVTVASWTDDDEYYHGANDGDLYHYNALLEKQSSARFNWDGRSGGGPIENGAILVFPPESAGPMREINIDSGIWRLSNTVTIPEQEKFILIEDIVGSLGPCLTTKAGITKVGSSYWIAVSARGYSLVEISSDGNILAAKNMGQDEIQHMSSDGENIWVLTASQIIKVTPP